MRKSLLSVILIFCSIAGFGQATDTLKTYTLQSATIIAYQEKPVRKTSLNLSILKIDSLSRYGNYNLTDLMARTPGVSMLSTGVAIVLISSCEKDEGKLPNISFKTGGSYISADAILAGGGDITIGIDASKSENTN